MLEYLQASVSSSVARETLRNEHSDDVKTGVILMGVKKSRISLDSSIALDWLAGFQTAISTSIDPMNQRTFRGPVQLDGTLYQLHYHGNTDLSVAVAGCEVDSDCISDIPIIRWMDKVRRRGGAMRGAHDGKSGGKLEGKLGKLGDGLIRACFPSAIRRRHRHDRRQRRHHLQLHLRRRWSGRRA